MTHVACSSGSALNVVVGIDQLRDLLTTLKRSTRGHGESSVELDAPARARLDRETRVEIDPFFPFGPLTAVARPRADGAVVFAVYSSRFPFDGLPIFAYEELPETGGFGAVGRIWFGGARGLKPYVRSALDAEALARVARAIDALRRDALDFFDYRSGLKEADRSREQFERTARLSRKLERTVASRKDLAQALADVAGRLAPKMGEESISAGDTLVPPGPAATTADERAAPLAHGAAQSAAGPAAGAPPPR